MEAERGVPSVTEEPARGVVKASNKDQVLYKGLLPKMLQVHGAPTLRHTLSVRRCHREHGSHEAATEECARDRSPARDTQPEGASITETERACMRF